MKYLRRSVREAALEVVTHVLSYLPAQPAHMCPSRPVLSQDIESCLQTSQSTETAFATMYSGNLWQAAPVFKEAMYIWWPLKNVSKRNQLLNDMNFIQLFCSKSIESKPNEIVTDSVSGKNNAGLLKILSTF